MVKKSNDFLFFIFGCFYVVWALENQETNFYFWDLFISSYLPFVSPKIFGQLGEVNKILNLIYIGFFFFFWYLVLEKMRVILN